MNIINNISEMQKISIEAKYQGKVIGFVPTMGYLHEGHLSLVEAARKTCDLIVMSIFVNPLQFGIGEDYEVYPRDLTRDAQLAESVGVDYLFHPQVADMYPKGYNSFVDVENITEGLCGAKRPGHFKGVTTVVTKLFNIVQPQKAFFGQKDAQQVAVIKRMVTDLNMPLEIVVVPIKREDDGLAMSSRNVYLSVSEREQALSLYKALQISRQIIHQGERSIDNIKKAVYEEIIKNDLAVVDYIEIVNADNLTQLYKIEGKILIALAVKFGNTRLIDNIILEVQ